jgi:hypothetical protein
MPADKFFPRPHKMVVSVGPPLTFPDAPDAREGWERVAKETEAAVRTLKAARDAKNSAKTSAKTPRS